MLSYLSVRPFRSFRPFADELCLVSLCHETLPGTSGNLVSSILRNVASSSGDIQAEFRLTSILLLALKLGLYFSPRATNIIGLFCQWAKLRLSMLLVSPRAVSRRPNSFTVTSVSTCTCVVYSTWILPLFFCHWHRSKNERLLPLPISGTLMTVYFMWGIAVVYLTLRTKCPALLDAAWNHLVSRNFVIKWHLSQACTYLLYDLS